MREPIVIRMLCHPTLLEKSFQKRCHKRIRTRRLLARSQLRPPAGLLFRIAQPWATFGVNIVVALGMWPRQSDESEDDRQYVSHPAFAFIPCTQTNNPSSTNIVIRRQFASLVCWASIYAPPIIIRAMMASILLGQPKPYRLRAEL